MGRLGSLGFHWLYRRAYLLVEDELAVFDRVSVADLRRLLDEFPLTPWTIVSVGTNVELTPPI